MLSVCKSVITLSDFAVDAGENTLISFLYFLMQKSFVMDITWTNGLQHEYFPFLSPMNVVESLI